MPNTVGFIATLNKIEDKGKYSEVRFSTVRKDKYEKDEQKQWKWSNWFGTFVGSAHTMLAGMSEKDRIFITSAMVTNEPYEVDGKKKWPGHKWVVFS